MEYLVNRIKELVFPLFSQRGYDLLEIVIKREKGRMILRMLVDRSTGGITLDECAALNSDISRLLDEADLIQESFSLEVSSPGLDRLLREEKDFQRKITREIRVFTREPINNQTEFKGKLLRTTPEAITLLINSREVVIPLDKISKAREVF